MTAVTMDETIGMAKMRDGESLAYRLVEGHCKGRCVLIHALAMDHSFWDLVRPMLQSHCDVLVYDCRGHGRSAKPDQPFTAELFADDLADLLDAVGWDRAVVCGASMGGCVSIAFAAAYPERVEALGLFDTTAFYGEGGPAAWEERAQKAVEGGMSALVGFQRTRWFGDTFREENPQTVDAYVSVFLANDIDAYVRTCRMLGAVDKRSALPGFSFPVRVAVGSEDYATPVAMAERLRDAIPGAELKIFEGARHFTPIEVPDLTAGEIISLIEAVD